MKLRKVISLALAAAMAVSLGVGGVSAQAAGADDAALQAVTLKVKNILNLDTEIYTEFSGVSSEDVLTGRRWNLQWWGDGVSLTIRADDDGKIYSYNKSETASQVNEPVFYGGRFDIPSLPTGDSAKALQAAKDFLAQVLTPGLETVELTDDTQPSLHQSSFRFSSMILLNGKESPLDCSVTVRASDNQVLRFWRSDDYSSYAGEIPSPTTSVSDAQARRDLRSTLEMEPYYILDDDGVTAHVRYVPKAIDDYYVDGKTGKLVNLTELRQKLWESGSLNRYYGVADKEMAMDAMATEESMANGVSLSQVELDGAAKLAGAMDKEALDTAVKNAWPEIGLDKYTLSSASYSVTELPVVEGADKKYDVTCRLVYGLKLTDSTARKVVKVNAKTGELLSLSGYRPYQENIANTVSLGQAQVAAETILKSFAGKNFATLELYNPAKPSDFGKKDTQFGFTYCQKENGYFFPNNRYYVTVDAVDGTISQLVKDYNEDVTLVDPVSVVPVTTAIEAYEGAMALRYGYLEVPMDIKLAEPELYARYKDELASYVNTLQPGFTLVQPDRYVRGVDAATGEVFYAAEDVSAETGITYDDVAGTWIETAANTLAKYGVGFYGGSLRRTDELTQLDMLALLCSLDGYRINVQDADEDEIDYLYQHGYMLGLVTPETRDEGKTVTRGELVKIILDAAGYKKIAAMTGIFRCDFTDAVSIPQTDYGYAALAQGLGLVYGGSDGAYAAQRVANRGEAIAMLYQYMS